MDLQRKSEQKVTRREATGGSEYRGGIAERRAGLSARLLYINAAILVVLIAGSFALPLSNREHWVVSICSALLLGLNLAIIDESHRRARRYEDGGPGHDEQEDPTDPFVEF